MYNIQKTLPNKGNKYYNTKSNGGYSECIQGYPTVDGLNVLDNCFSGETKYITEEGLKDFYSTVGTTQFVLNENGEFVPAEIKEFGKQQLYKVTLENKMVIYATANHRWVVDSISSFNGKKYTKRKIKTTLELTKSDNIPYNYYKGNNLLDKKGIIHGLVFGDGYKNKNCNTYTLHLFGDKVELKKYLPKHIYSDYNLKEVPSIYESEEYLRGFIAGVIATDGTITNNTFKISNIDKDVLEQISNICYKIGIGINGIYQETRDIDIGKYHYKNHTIYYLTFKRKNIETLLLKSSDKNKLIKDAKNIKYTHISSIEPTDRFETVYCAVEPKTHTITLEGNILTGQCVGWACGRFNEIYSIETGYEGMKYPRLHCNAEYFIDQAKSLGLQVQKEPCNGGIMVWEGKGNLAGHVAVVEQVIDNNTVLTSESGYNHFDFKNEIRKNDNGRWGTNSNYPYLGCIINPSNPKPNVEPSGGFPFEGLVKKGSPLYNEQGQRYKYGASADRDVTVESEVDGRYKVWGSTFNPHTVYVDKGNVVKKGDKYPFNAVVKKGSDLYDKYGNRYKYGTRADRNVIVQGEYNGRYEIYSEDFSPNVVYCDKSSIK